MNRANSSAINKLTPNKGKGKGSGSSRRGIACYAPTVCLAGVFMFVPKAIAQTDLSPDSSLDLPIVNVTVNSDLDGPVTPDQSLTLREAIEIVNGTLPLNALSPAESALVTPSSAPQISFALPGDTRIELVELLPTIEAAGLMIDGTTQPGYGQSSEEPAAVPVMVPAVSITPSVIPGAEVFRGLTIAADRVTVKGLSLYGFSSLHRSTASTPPADIFISHIGPNAFDRSRTSANALRLTEKEIAQAPEGVVITDNWLGVSPEGGIPDPEEMSAFGVSVFNAVDTTIQRNRIEYHESSGIITGNFARNLVVTENTIIGNGLRGQSDGIYLQGDIEGSQIVGNLVCANDGSGVAMFKPEGTAEIYENDIRFNGRRLRSAAVSLMGSGHRVTDNYIAYQPGPGVLVSAYPRARQNLVRNNFFRGLNGLSVDLAYNDGVRVSDYQFGDGPNPHRNSGQRRRDSANAAINAPEFDAYAFPFENVSTLTGYADPGSEIGIYEISSRHDRLYGTLGNLLTTVEVGDDGRFSAAVEVADGTEVGAIATDPRYGTSEPSPVAIIGQSIPVGPGEPAFDPVCQESALPGEVIEEDTEETIEAPQPPPDEQITLRIPRNIHFALDESFISPASALVLDQVATALLEYPTLTVELQGHTDPRASNEYNEALGQRRALSARDYLLQRGVAPERMRIRSFGETQLISTGPDIVDYARDRRVEFIFLDTRGLDIVIEAQESDLQIE
ncbi:MAG: OmpA family protein [Cyanobacteria bacterium P01_D01_bin.1]